MARTVWLSGVALVVCALAGLLRGYDGPRPAAGGEKDGVRPLEDAVVEAIRKAEPSVACVLVSRSREYDRRFNDRPPANAPWKLGSFSWEPYKADRGRLDLDEGVLKRERDAKRLDLSYPRTVPDLYGSGVVIDEKERLVLTNYHVIRGATKVYVRLPGDRGSYANIQAADPRSDLAVLQLISSDLRVQAIKMGDGRAVRKGQFVVSLANPYAAGFRDGSPSASWGIISNIRRRSVVNLNELDRTKLTLAQFDTLLQLDARLNLGCSGGAVVNLKGELIGLTTALAALTGVETPGGFALPITPHVRKIIKKLCEGEEVEYGFLGVTMNGTDPGKRTRGYWIKDTVPAGPARLAGLKAKDVVLAIDDNEVRESDDVFLYIGTALADEEVRIKAERPGGGTQVYTARLVKSYVPGKIIASRARNPKDYGGLTVDYTSVLMQKRSFRIDEPMPSGVIVRQVQPNTSAARAKLQPDRIITHVNGRAVQKPARFYDEVEKARQMGARSVELTLVSEAGRQEKVKIQLDNN
jgi:S1-C subfamily serine protease